MVISGEIDLLIKLKVVVAVAHNSRNAHVQTGKRTRGNSENSIRQLPVVCVLYQILALYDAFSSISVDSVVHYVSSLQQNDGSFYGDKWGEVDTRFSFCAVACLALLVSGYIHLDVAYVPGAPIKNNPLEKLLYISNGSTSLSQTFSLYV